MLVKLMGVMDIYCAMVIAVLHFKPDLGVFAAVAWIYLLVKLIIFHSDWVSWVDGVLGIYIILMTLGLSTKIDLFLAIYLLQKGIFSIINFG